MAVVKITTPRPELPPVIKIKNNGGSEATIESITLQKNDGTFIVIAPLLSIPLPPTPKIFK